MFTDNIVTCSESRVKVDEGLEGWRWRNESNRICVQLRQRRCQGGFMTDSSSKSERGGLQDGCKYIYIYI